MTDETNTAEQPAPSTGVAEYDPIAAGLHALQVRLKDRAYDLSTTAGLDEAKKDRRELVKTRTGLNALRLELNAKDRETIAAKIEKRNTAAELLTKEITALETPIDEQIKAEEKRREEVKAAKAEAESKRIAALIERTSILAKLPLDIIGKSAAEMLAAIEAAEAIVIGDDFEERKAQAEMVLADALVKMRQIHESQAKADAAAAEQRERIAREEAEATARRELQAKEDEERAALLRKQQEELQEQQRAFEERQRLADEEARQAKEKSDAEAARVESIRNRIRDLSLIPTQYAGKVSTEIAAKAVAVEQMTLEGFEEFASEAAGHALSAAQELRRMAAIAEKAEADAAENTRKASELEEQRKSDDARRAAEKAEKDAADAKAAAEQKVKDEAERAERLAKDKAEAAEKIAEGNRQLTYRAAAAQMLQALQAVAMDGGFMELGMATRDAVHEAVETATTVKPNPITMGKAE